YNARILQPPALASVVVSHFDVPPTTIVNDDSERPCGSLVFYDFDSPSFPPVGKAFTFTPTPTFVAQAPAITGQNGTLDNRAKLLAKDFTHSELLQTVAGVFKNDPNKPKRDDSLAAASNRWSTTPQPRFFEFTV